MRSSRCEQSHAFSTQAWRMNFRMITSDFILMENPDKPNMGKALKSLQSFRWLQIRADLQFRQSLLHQTRLARRSKFIFIAAFNKANRFNVHEILRRYASVP